MTVDTFVDMMRDYGWHIKLKDGVLVAPADELWVVTMLPRELWPLTQSPAENATFRRYWKGVGRTVLAARQKESVGDHVVVLFGTLAYPDFEQFTTWMQQFLRLPWDVRQDILGSIAVKLEGDVAGSLKTLVSQILNVHQLL